MRIFYSRRARPLVDWSHLGQKYLPSALASFLNASRSPQHPFTLRLNVALLRRSAKPKAVVTHSYWIEPVALIPVSLTFDLAIKCPPRAQQTLMFQV